MTRYQLELLNPVSGEWVPHGTPARSMTAAHLWGLRMYPTIDLRVVPVEVADVVRRMVVDGQPVLVTPGVLETVVIDELTKRRAEKEGHDENR